MSNDKLFNIPNRYMINCDINWCDILLEKER
jgi:hypothetical protein